MTDSAPARPATPKIPFGKPAIVGREIDYIQEAISNGTIAGGGPFMRRCEDWLQTHLPAPKVLLTHSCTAALEMAALLSEVGPGDEVIMPSFTFSSTATAFVLRRATPVFVDIRPDTLNLDERKFEAAITPKTKAVVVVHYAGLACAMDEIMSIAGKYGLIVIEDAAQAHLSHYRGRPLGTIGHFGCLSFHETKNIISGEGGALMVNDGRFHARAEIIREKGTDRSRFFRGEIDKYTWLDVGSSYCPGEIVAAFLLAQLEKADEICARRRALYDLYRAKLEPLARRRRLVLPNATGGEANGHIFWIRVNDEQTRTALLAHLTAAGVHAVFHYVPLHSAPAGRRFGRQAGNLAVTDLVSQTLIRLPLYLQMTDDDVARVAATIEDFFEPGLPSPPFAAGPQ